MQDYGKKFCLFYQLHFWNVLVGAWPYEQGEGSTVQNDSIKRVLRFWGEKQAFWGKEIDYLRGKLMRLKEKSVRRGTGRKEKGGG